MTIFDLTDADIVHRLQRMRQHCCSGTCQRYESVEQLKSSVMARDEAKSVINAAIREIKMLRKQLAAGRDRHHEGKTID